MMICFNTTPSHYYQGICFSKPLLSLIFNGNYHFEVNRHYCVIDHCYDINHNGNYDDDLY